MTVHTIDAALYRQMLCSGAAALQAKKEDVNRLNVFPVPDGDTGTNMFLTLDAVRTSDLGADSLAGCAEAAAKAVMRAARGNSGVILSLFFRGMAKAFAGHETADVPLLLEAFRVGADTARRAVMKPVEGTILTVMRECCSPALVFPEDDLIGAFELLSDAAEETLKKTPEMLPALKRAKVVDSGGLGFTVVLSGMLRALRGEPAEEPVSDGNAKEADFSEFSAEEITFTFCTECLLTLNPDVDPEKIEALRAFLPEIGDSIVLVSDSEILKLHVHSNEPMTVLNRVLELGEPQLIKVENMRQQHHALAVNGGAAEPAAPARHEAHAAEHTEERERIPYGIITVANGDGLSDLFKELGAGYVIAGGQSMNPSANEFLRALKELNCEKAILLPNNSNIVLTAQQAAELAEHTEVGVVRSVTIPQGVSALLAFDPSASLEDNLAAMTDAAAAVTTLSVTRAVKNADINNVKVTKRQYIGLVNNDLRYAEDTPEDCIRALIEEIRGRETVTVYYGKDVKAEDAGEMAEMIREVLGSDCEVNVISGRQPIYSYLISAE